LAQVRLPSKVRHKLRPRQINLRLNRPQRIRLPSKKRSSKVAVKVKVVKVKAVKAKAAVAVKVDLDSVAVAAAVVVEGWVHSVNL
jgi:hypothetical protein